MGTLADVAQMKRKLDDATCSAIPCVGCVGMVNKVYSIGESPMNPTDENNMVLGKANMPFSTKFVNNEMFLRLHYCLMYLKVFLIQASSSCQGAAFNKMIACTKRTCKE